MEKLTASARELIRLRQAYGAKGAKGFEKASKPQMNTDTRRYGV
jgi:hypothetical protein